MKMPPQIMRLVLLTIAIVASYVTARQILTPHSFGQYGWYRGDALEEVAGRAPVFAGQQACAECHAEALKKVTAFEHKSVSCESCHGLNTAHTQEPKLNKIPPMANGQCIRCHERDPSKPAWLKQINSQVHYKGDRCTECHIPHQPNEVP